MRSALVDYLVCPDCHSELTVGGGGPPVEVVEDGSLICATGHTFPIVRGVPDFVGGALGTVTQRTARSFGDQWQRFREDHATHRARSAHPIP